MSFFVLPFALLFIAFVLQFYTMGLENENTVPCPRESDITCISCECGPSDGFNICTPLKYCPPPVSSKQEMSHARAGKCKHGEKFFAQCTLCECSGKGKDHCAMCFALPVRRIGQPAHVNKELPLAYSNRFFNYEINGWSISADYDDRK